MNEARWLPTVLVAVAVTSSCVESEAPQRPPPAPARDVSHVFGDSPGPQWFDRDGRPLDRFQVIASMNGSEHCGWERAVLLHLQRPAGADMRRQYARDPIGVLGRPKLTDRFDPQAVLPKSATPTGYHISDVELWLGEDGDYAYLVFDDHVERWPRVVPPVGCD